MICPNCNAVVSDSVKFCENCGAALPTSDIAQDATISADDTTATLAQEADELSFPQSDSAQTSAYTAQLSGDSLTSGEATLNSAAQGETPSDQPYGSYDSTQQFEQQAPSQPSAGSQQTWQQPTDQPYADTQQTWQQPTDQQGFSSNPPGVYAPADTGTQASTAPFVLAIIALVTAFLGIFPVSIVLAIIALVMNSNQKKRGEFSTKQGSTKVMSIISLVVSGLMLIATIAIGGMVATYLASGDFNTSTSGKSGITSSVKTTSSSASSTNASTTSADAVMDKLVGTWKLTGLTSNGEVINADDIKLMQDMGLTVELTINKDGSASLMLFGAEMSGTWESSDGATVNFTLDGDRVISTVAGDELTMAEGSDVLVFTKA